MSIPDAQPDSPPDAPHDALIVRRVLAGDVEAFAVLVDRHHARCLRVAMHLLGDGDDAEDAVQEAFVRAYRHLGGYRERDKFGAWLLRVVVNACRTHAARQRRWSGPDLSAVADCDALVDPGVDPTDDAARRDALARALARLAPAQREAVVLRFTDDLSYDEMSTVTGVGVSALKMRVQRACARLRDLLSEQLHA
jgi:RNA polymerase sigma-70 factor (ECF subfamily)